MTILAKTTKSAINSLKNRIVTAMGYNVISAIEVAPAGVDCPPIPGQLALYMDTDKRNSPVFVGYVNNGLLAEPGERRIFATSTDGVEKCRIWLHNDHTVEIGGSGAAGSNINNPTVNAELQTILQSYFSELFIAINAGVVSGATFTFVPPVSPIDLTASAATTILIP